MQIRKVILAGTSVAPASVDFEPGGNILAGQSDTGKSYLFRCIDYVLGADEFKKRVPEDEPYSHVYVEFENSEGASLTLERSLSGGDVAAHYCKYHDIYKPSEKISARRAGKGQSKDITAVLFPFAGMEAEAKIRKNDRGETQRLTIRTLVPIFFVNEVAMIDEKSLVVGNGTFDVTARKRMLAYLLTGKDDTGIISAERSDILGARSEAQRDLILEMIEPLERKVADFADDPEVTVEKINAAIQAVTKELSSTTEERSKILSALQANTADLQQAETQLIAVDQVLLRYELLDKRYASDLERLDFIAEGAHFFEGLQETICPLCEQPMGVDHKHTAGKNSGSTYEGAKVEAAKIKALRIDLAETMQALSERKAKWKDQEKSSQASIEKLDIRLNQILAPNLKELNSRLEVLIQRRVSLESIRNDQDQLTSLKLMKKQFENVSKSSGSKVLKWEQLPSVALRTLCKSIEEVLAEWGWGNEPRVEFDQREYDIVVDGQSRQSHGKGVRSVLYAAFVIGLLRYSVKQGKPHPGFVVLDSPLTSYRKSPSINDQDMAVSVSIEAMFWASLTKVSSDMQIIIIENKEPPPNVSEAVHYQWFGGDTALPNQRSGFIPFRG